MAAAVSGATATSALAAKWDDASFKKLESSPIVVVSIPACPYCKRAKEALTQAGYQYVDLDASVDTELRQAVRDVTGIRTVPQIFVGGASIGGSDALAEQLASDTFKATVSSAAGKPALPTSLLNTTREAWQRASAAAAAAAADAEASGGSQEEQAAVAALAQAVGAEPSQGGVARSDSRVGPRTLKTFTGQALLDWLAAHPSSHASVSTEAQAAADALLRNNHVTPAAASYPYTPVPLGVAGVTAAKQQLPSVSRTASYTLVSETPAPVKGMELNTKFWWSGSARPATQVASELRGLILALYDKYLAPDGRKVAYSAMKADPLFQQYTAASAELQRVDLTPLSRDELFALFVNLYNAVIIHALCVLGPPSAASRGAFFSKDAAYNIGGRKYTADDMENGVLRGNKAAASNLLCLVGLHGWAKGVWDVGDPRCAKVVTPLDARLHFALVCGAKSCPPIKLYTPDNLEEGLAAAGEAFCAGEVVVDRASHSVALSKIFQWYAPDFGRDDKERLRYISQFLQGQAKSDLEAMLASGKAIKVTYRTYDWGLNE